jgi:peptidoglycan/LPS O-acetylase OafA/YrhL
MAQLRDRSVGDDLLRFEPVLRAGRSTSYFGATINASPLLHTWTLAVEEQFYLVWPVVLFAIARATAGSRPRTRVYAIGTLTALSLLFSLRLTNELAPSAFYGLGSRAWEFGCGALLACTVPFWKRQRQRSRDVLSLAGVALLVVALVQITGKTPYPGRAALLPVSAALALLASGIGTSSVVGVALARPALRAIGRISYSWYLWHWPVLLFGEHMLNRSTLTVRVALLTFSVVPAIASYRLVERPIRQNIVLGRSLRATVRTVGAFVAATIVAASVLTVVGDHELRDPYIAMLARARADRPPLNLSCWVTDPSVVLRSCVSGDANATRTIMVVGDSHAAQWLPAIDEAARELHVRVVTSVEGNCPGIGRGWTDQTASCTTRLRHLPELIRTLHPALVISSNSSGYIGVLVDARGKRVRSSGQLGAWGDEMFTFASELRADNIPLLDVLDTPHYASDPLDCLANDRDASRCSLRRDTAVASVAAIHKAEIDALTRAGHGTVLDPSDILCGSRECPIVVGGQVTYNDGGHLTKSYAATLGGVFTGAIRTTTR